MARVCELFDSFSEEWLVERDWFIVNHWEDQFCRDVYQDLCVCAEFQHLRATALLSPGTTPRVCPVDNLMNTHPSPPLGDQVMMDTLDPCAWRYVLTMDDLASFRSQNCRISEICSFFVKLPQDS